MTNQNKFEATPMDGVERGLLNGNETPPLDTRRTFAARWKLIQTQTISAIIMTGIMIHAGLTLTFPNLLVADHPKEIISSYASIGALVTPFGTICISLISDRLGRKKTLILVQSVNIVSWIFLAISPNIPCLLLGSAMGGMTRGALTSIIPTYVSELTNSDLRQVFLSLMTTFFAVGAFLITFVKIILTWREAAIVFAIFFSVLLCLFTVTVSESPHWLAVIKLDSINAKIILRKYNPDETIFNKEWNLIQEKVISMSVPPSFTKIISIMRLREVHRPFFILIGLVLYQQLCGVYPMSSFTVKIIPKLSEALGVKFTNEIFLLMGVSRLMITILTSIFLNKFNQKQLLMFSSIGMIVTGLPISLLTYFTPVHDDLRPTDWLLMSFFLTYVLVSSIGILGIPWTIIFELLPTNARGLVGPLVVGFGYTMMALHLQFFLDIIDHGHVTTIFIFYSILATVGTVYIKKCLPETRGKSLYEIERFFDKKKEKEAEKNSNQMMTEKV